MTAHGAPLRRSSKTSGAGALGGGGASVTGSDGAVGNALSIVSNLTSLTTASVDPSLSNQKACSPSSLFSSLSSSMADSDRGEGEEAVLCSTAASSPNSLPTDRQQQQQHRVGLS